MKEYPTVYVAINFWTDDCEVFYSKKEAEKWMEKAEFPFRDSCDDWITILEKKVHR